MTFELRDLCNVLHAEGSTRFDLTGLSSGVR